MPKELWDKKAYIKYARLENETVSDVQLKFTEEFNQLYENIYGEGSSDISFLIYESSKDGGDPNLLENFYVDRDHYVESKIFKYNYDFDKVYYHSANSRFPKSQIQDKLEKSFDLNWIEKYGGIDVDGSYWRKQYDEQKYQYVNSKINEYNQLHMSRAKEWHDRGWKYDPVEYEKEYQTRLNNNINNLKLHPIIINKFLEWRLNDDNQTISPYVADYNGNVNINLDSVYNYYTYGDGKDVEKKLLAFDSNAFTILVILIGALLLFSHTLTVWHVVEWILILGGYAIWYFYGKRNRYIYGWVLQMRTNDWADCNDEQKRFVLEATTNKGSFKELRRYLMKNRDVSVKCNPHPPINYSHVRWDDLTWNTVNNHIENREV